MTERTFIWIRHAQKEYSNSHAPKGKPLHDPDIVPGAQEKIDGLRAKLIETFGLPVWCFSSPYLRARTTADLLVGPLGTPVTYDPKIGEYLGWQKGTLDICPSTRNVVETETKLPPLGESLRALDERCLEHLRELDRLSSGVYWIITHGVVIEHLTRLLGLKSKEPSYLDWVVIRN